MRRLMANLILAMVLALPAACSATDRQGPVAAPAAKAGEEGSSFEHAVVLADAKTEGEGISAEHAWTRRHFPGWHWETQGLAHHDGRVYDIIDIANGNEHREIYFDITDWFGHL